VPGELGRSRARWPFVAQPENPGNPADSSDDGVDLAEIT
jgi:hypothetical protein